MQDACQRVRIMCRKLRIQFVGGIDEHPRTGEVGNVGMRFASEYGIAFESQFLSVFDFRIPVRTFDESHGDPPAGGLGGGY